MKAGDIVGEKYRLTRRIGKGANGIVWEATNTATEGSVALKMLLQSADADQRERLIREGKACGRIKHPNVVEVIDVAVEGDPATGGTPFLVMPLLKGRTLAEALLGKALTLEESLGYLRDIGRGLVAAHEADVVHRDLKPQNVFLHEDGEGTRVKILDFGISRINTSPSSLTAADRTLGSPQYMSPEQLLGSKVDQRADLWSFGVIAFQLFARRLPFTGVNILATLTKVQSGEIPKLPPVAANVDAALSKLVASCLVRELDARVQTAAECVSALDQLLDVMAREPRKSDAGMPSGAVQGGDSEDGDAARGSAPALDDEWDLEAIAPPASKPLSSGPPASKAPPAKEAAPNEAVAEAPIAKDQVATEESSKSSAAAPVATVGGPTAPHASSPSPLRRRLSGLTKSVEPELEKEKAASVETEPEELSLATGDLQISKGEAPKILPKPPKPPPKPPGRKDSTDHAVAAVFADLGLEEPKKAAVPIAAAKPDGGMFEDLRLDLSEPPSAPRATSEADARSGAGSDAETEPSARGAREEPRVDAEASSETKQRALALTPTPDVFSLTGDEPLAKPDPLDGSGEDPASGDERDASGAALDASSEGRDEEKSAAAEAALDVPAAKGDAASFEDDAIAPPPTARRTSLYLGVAAIVAVVVVAIVVASASGSKPQPEASNSSTPKASAQPAAPTPTPPPTPTPTATETQSAPAATSAEPPASASASASAAPSASAPKPRANPNWKPPVPLAQPTGI